VEYARKNRAADAIDGDNPGCVRTIQLQPDMRIFGRHHRFRESPVRILINRRTVCSAALLVLLSASVRPIVAQTPATIDSLALGRKWTAWLYADQLDSLVAAYPSSAQSPSLRASLVQDREELLRRAGTEVKLIDERFIKRNGQTQYWRTAQFSNPSVGEPVMVRWAVNAVWQIIGLGINPASAAPPVDKP